MYRWGPEIVNGLTPGQIAMYCGPDAAREQKAIDAGATLSIDPRSGKVIASFKDRVAGAKWMTEQRGQTDARPES